MKEVDRTYEAVLPPNCPRCGGEIGNERVVAQYQEEIPRRPIVLQFNVHVGECVCCGQRVQGHHNLQTSDALGAACSQLGPDAQAAVVFFNKRCGLSYGKISELFWQVFGIKLTRGGAAQIVHRAAQRSTPLYEEIKDSVRTSPCVVPDETGWKVGGRKAWLHVLVGEEATCYDIDKRRSADVTAGILGWNYSGRLVHDGLSSYDRFQKAEHQQCVAHLMRRVKKMLETAVGGAVHFPRRVLELFHAALALRDAYRAGRLTEDDLADGYLILTVELEQLTERPKQNADNARLAKHLKKHLFNWFWFLLVPWLDATNYLAEQALRLPIVNRKVWGGNRTDIGKEDQKILASVLETLTRQSRELITFFSELLRGCAPQLLPHP